MTLIVINIFNEIFVFFTFLNPCSVQRAKFYRNPSSFSFLKSFFKCGITLQIYRVDLPITWYIIDIYCEVFEKHPCYVRSF